MNTQNFFMMFDQMQINFKLRFIFNKNKDKFNNNNNEYKNIIIWSFLSRL